MDDGLGDRDFRPRPTPERPLLGLTILVVEDSRYASEAMRLLCLRSGARIRRADCIASAKRHLNVYRPGIAIVDLGLPDGSGLDLIAHMGEMKPAVPIILGTSGADRDQASADCAGVGAHGFLAKPIESVAAFQQAILTHLPSDLRTTGPHAAQTDPIAPDPIAFREDLNLAMDLLALDQPPLPYLRRFLTGLARIAHDDGLMVEAGGLTSGLADHKRRALRAFLSARIERLSIAV